MLPPDGETEAWCTAAHHPPVKLVIEEHHTPIIYTLKTQIILQITNNILNLSSQLVILVINLFLFHFKYMLKYLSKAFFVNLCLVC